MHSNLQIGSCRGRLFTYAAYSVSFFSHIKWPCLQGSHSHKQTGHIVWQQEPTVFPSWQATARMEDRRMGHPPFYMQGKLGKHTTNDKRIKNHRSSSRYIPWTQANQANAKLALPAWYYYNQAFDFARRQQFLSWCPWRLEYHNAFPHQTFLTWMLCVDCDLQIGCLPLWTSATSSPSLTIPCFCKQRPSY